MAGFPVDVSLDFLDPDLVERHRAELAATVLAAGLDGQPAADILAVPDDFYAELGLAALISPLRLRGMSAMLTRIKRRLREAN